MTNPTLSTTGVGTEAYYHPMAVSDMNQHCYVRDDPHISLATSIEVDHDTRHTRSTYPDLIRDPETHRSELISVKGYRDKLLVDRNSRLDASTKTKQNKRNETRWQDLALTQGDQKATLRTR